MVFFFFLFSFFSSSSFVLLLLLPLLRLRLSSFCFSSPSFRVTPWIRYSFFKKSMPGCPVFVWSQLRFSRNVGMRRCMRHECFEWNNDFQKKIAGPTAQGVCQIPCHTIMWSWDHAIMGSLCDPWVVISLFSRERGAAPGGSVAVFTRLDLAHHTLTSLRTKKNAPKTTSIF